MKGRQKESEHKKVCKSERCACINTQRMTNESEICQCKHTHRKKNVYELLIDENQIEINVDDDDDYDDEVGKIVLQKMLSAESRKRTKTSPRRGL